MKNVIEFLENNLSDNDTVILACSGGPDSMVLFDILLKLNKKIRIICAHVNHKYRKESDLEEIKVKEYCDNHNVTFRLYTINEYKKGKFSEEESRDIRYKFFDNLKEEYNAKYIISAHHADDLMETILMRMVRGSNLKGYIGFKEKTDKFLRPLIYVTKSEIMSYASLNNLWYAVDKSNMSLKHTRNRYRIKMLPFLKNENNLVHEKFLKFSKELNTYYEFVYNYVYSKYDNEIKNNKFSIDIINNEERFIVKFITQCIIENIQKIDKLYVSDKNISDIMLLIYSDKSSGKINLNNNYVFYKDYNNCYIKKFIENKVYNYTFDNSIYIDNIGYFKIIEEDINENSNYIIRLSKNDIKLPLCIRNRKNGDFIYIKNMEGKKKIKDILIDEKINKEYRDRLPIVTDSNDNILWMPGIKKSKFDKNFNEKYDIIIKYEEEKNEKK